tara:strand:+ start:234 stop:437 length:204 start_codon:yes stop_codon:yes gene_type:complete
MKKYTIIYQYIYEDSETVEVEAETQHEAEVIAEDERCGPNMAWDAPFCTQDDIYSVEEEDIEEEVEV